MNTDDKNRVIFLKVAELLTEVELDMEKKDNLNSYLFMGFIEVDGKAEVAAAGSEQSFAMLLEVLASSTPKFANALKGAFLQMIEKHEPLKYPFLKKTH